MTGGEDDGLDLGFLGDDGLMPGAGEDTQQETQQQTSPSPDRAFEVRGQQTNVEQRPPADAQQTKQVQNNAQQQQQTQQGSQGNQAAQDYKATGPVRPLGNSGHYTDQRGNVVDREGHIVAFAGRERRMWQEVQRSRASISELTSELERVRKSSDDIGLLNGLPKSMGLTPDDVRESMSIVKMFKENPVLAARDVLARAKALGYTMEQIVGKGPADNGIDLAAVNRLLDARLGPVSERNQQQAQEEQDRAEAVRAYNHFMDTHENADIHEDVIARLLNRRKAEGVPMSVEAAYFAVREFVRANGLNFNAPIEPQIAAMRAAVDQQTNPQTQRSATVPGTPNGFRGAPAAQAQVQSQPDIYNDSDDWKEIIRREAQLAGVNRS